MNHKEAKKWLEKKLHESNINFEDEMEVIKFMRELKKEYPKEMKLLLQSKFKFMFLDTISTIWLYLRNILKIPIYVLSLLIMLMFLPFRKTTISKIVMNLAFRKYDKETEYSIYEKYDVYSNHATAIFYILILFFLIVKK